VVLELSNLKSFLRTSIVAVMSTEVGDGANGWNASCGIGTGCSY
jgi:hypothetical protein